jgi:hypothetical protein
VTYPLSPVAQMYVDSHAPKTAPDDRLLTVLERIATALETIAKREA